MRKKPTKKVGEKIGDLCGFLSISPKNYLVNISLKVCLDSRFKCLLYFIVFPAVHKHIYLRHIK